MKYKIKRRIIFGISIFLFISLYFFKNTSILLRILATLTALISFYIFDHYYDANFELKHYSYILAFCFFGIFLSPFYFLYENYDKVLHLVIPIIASSIVFFIVNKQNLSLKWKITITLMFTIGTLTIFEVVEYILDTLWNFQLQGVYVREITGLEKFDIIMDKNDDTMIDLILGIFSSMIFSSYKIIENWKNKTKKGI